MTVLALYVIGWAVSTVWVLCKLNRPDTTDAVCWSMLCMFWPVFAVGKGFLVTAKHIKKLRGNK